MGFLNAAEKAGKALGHTLLTPLDVAADALTLTGDLLNGDAPDVRESNTARRVQRVIDEANEAIEETYRD